MLELLENKVAITPLGDPDVSSGGIILTEKDRFDQGVVRYVGPNVMDVKVGDYVMFDGYSGKYVFVEGEGDMIILREDFITCRIVEFSDTDIPGLFFKDRDGIPFPATYEMAMMFIAQALGETEWGIAFRTKSASQRAHNFAARDKRATSQH